MKNELIKKEVTIDSRGAAEMVGKNHSDLLRDIKTYIGYLTESNFAFSDFFIESQYKDRSGKSNPCYQITRKGCEFIANKLTGQKGTLFTASYINKFHEMESGKYETPKSTPKANLSSVNNAVSIIIKQLDIFEDEVKKVWETNGSWQGVVNKYSDSVIDKVEEWLIENNYPVSILAKNGKNYYVTYDIAA